MLLGPRGEKIDVHAEADQKRLRGQRLNQIRKDMNNQELDDKERLLKYSSHLEWFMSKVKVLALAQDFWKSPGKWDMTRETKGFTNGLIVGLAIFVEEQADPPVIKKDPEKFELEDDRLVEDRVKGFMINLARQLECIICMGEDGWPLGYQDCDSLGAAWIEWRNDTIGHLEGCPVNFPEIRMIIDRISEFNQNLQDNK